MEKIDKGLIDKLNNVRSEIVNSIEKSCFMKELEVFENVQVHAGCGGCFGTQMSCRSDLLM